MTQVVFLSHGGGFLPLLGNPNYIELIQHLRQLSQNWEAPKQILMISAHWETSAIQITHHSNPPLLYDYKALVFSYLVSITNRQKFPVCNRCALNKVHLYFFLCVQLLPPAAYKLNAKLAQLFSLNRVNTISPSFLLLNQLIKFSLFHCCLYLLQCANQF